VTEAEEEVFEADVVEIAVAEVEGEVGTRADETKVKFSIANVAQVALATEDEVV
jgi:hypothetical protein